MPRQNRVTPYGELVATPQRGTLTGNRGCLHDDQGNIRRWFVGRRWIICLLDFKGRRRTVMTPGRYTELFFLDEATALAAGHRPCAECQRDRFNLFRDLWAQANLQADGSSRPGADWIDSSLHLERLAKFSRLCLPPALEPGNCLSLPDGTFFSDQAKCAYLVWKGRLLRWTFAGYEYVVTGSVAYPLYVLTPASIVRTLEAGYPVGVHPSALDAVR